MLLNPETFPIIMAHEPAAANGIGDTAAWCDLSKAKGVLITFIHYRGGDTSWTLDVHESAIGTGTTAIAIAFPIWAAVDALNDPTMVRLADGTGFTINTGTMTGSQIVQFYIDASILSPGCRYIQAGSTGGSASSYAAILYQLVGARYQGDKAI